MAGPEGNSLYLFHQNLNVSRGGVKGNIIYCFPRDQSLSDFKSHI